MKFPYAKPFRNSPDIFGFGLDKGEQTPQEWIERGAKIQQEMENGTFPKDIAPLYKCAEEIELLDADCIEADTMGNTGPHNDMVYFHTRMGKTAGFMIEMVLLYPEIFSRRGER